MAYLSLIFPMTTSTRFWLHLLLWLVCGFGITSGIITVVKEMVKRKLLAEGFGSGWRRTLLVITGERVTRQASKGLFLIFGVLLGYAMRDVVLLRRTETLSNVTINKRYTDFAYEITYGTDAVQNIRLCPEARVRFEPGDHFAAVSYEQKVGCKSIVGSNLGFFH